MWRRQAIPNAGDARQRTRTVSSGGTADVRRDAQDGWRRVQQRIFIATRVRDRRLLRQLPASQRGQERFRWPTYARCSGRRHYSSVPNGRRSRHSWPRVTGQRRQHGNAVCSGNTRLLVVLALHWQIHGDRVADRHRRCPHSYGTDFVSVRLKV